MNRDAAISTARSALRLDHNVTCDKSGGIWTWDRFGWKVVMWENGTVIAAIDVWGLGR